LANFGIAITYEQFYLSIKLIVINFLEKTKSKNPVKSCMDPLNIWWNTYYL